MRGRPSVLADAHESRMAGPYRAVLSFALLIILMHHVFVDGFARKSEKQGRRQVQGLQLSCPHAKHPVCRGAKSSGPLPPYRPVDGSCHKSDPTLGMAGTPFLRILPPKYGDGKHSMRSSVVPGRELPSPRDIVNSVFRDVDLPDQNVNHFFMNWGQLVAHDLTLTNTSIPKAGSPCCARSEKTDTSNQCGKIDIRKEDAFFSKHNVSCLGGPRSGGGACEHAHIDQWNRVTHFMDTSFIYSSDAATASKIRTYRGGQLACRNISEEDHLRVDD
ncbi:hypothetical protein FOCC_FOCC013428, partial [Frankliniella occidentalis]